MDRRKVWVAGAALLLAGCLDEGGPLELKRGQEPEAAHGALTCQVNVQSGSLACTPLKPMLPAGASGVVIGGQGSYVLLESSNVNYDSGTEVFSADVTVRNLLTQTLGTADGSSIDANGVRVFFHTMPAVTVGTGVVTVKNADGTSVFTESPAPYFQYDQVLSPGKVSLPRNWQWNVPASVETFTFTVYVSAAAAAEESIEAGPRIDARTITTGEVHSCGLTVSGAAWCWGRGLNGELGNGGIDDQTTPVAVTAPAGVAFVSISAGDQHTCAITSAGAAYCWGNGASGRLGNGGIDSHNTPVAVTAPGGAAFVSISGGYQHTCAVTSDGAAYCWGTGYLGNGSNETQTAPVAVAAPGGVTFVSISVGREHACAITADRAAYCWGDDSWGQLGSTTSVGSALTPVPVDAPAGASFVSITAGANHTCAITAAGAAYCWGRGFFGQIGNNLTDNQATPVAVAAPAGVTFVSINAGWDHTCAITPAGAAWCWGYGQLGTIGDGSIGDRTIPVAATPPGGATFVSISGGAAHTCATTSAGTAYCWGLNNNGQVGHGGAPGVHPSPAPVSTITNFAWLNLPAPAGQAPARPAFAAYALGGRVFPEHPSCAGPSVLGLGGVFPSGTCSFTAA